MKKIGFVCTGNTCRSPMAEAYFKSIVGDFPVEVYSAGLGALPGMPASVNAKQLMSSIGIDLEGHRSASLSTEKVESSDLILVMTEMHRVLFMEKWHDYKDKLYLLREFSKVVDPGNLDVFDPVGGSYEIYEKCFEMMKEPLERLGEMICKESE